MTISEYLAKAAEIVGGKPWGLGLGRPRIYLDSRRDAKVFISFEDAAYGDAADEISATCGLFGAKINCFIDDCGQSPNWYKSQKAKLLKHARSAFDAVSWFEFTGNEEEAARIFEDEFVIDDETAGHMVNGREAEARQTLGL